MKKSIRISFLIQLSLVPLLTAALLAVTSPAQAADRNAEPQPKIVNPGPVGGPPSDAIVLFDGKHLNHWNSAKGGPAKWNIEDGAMVVSRTGGIISKQEFGDIQLHIEWASPSEVKGKGQGRGNSGVYLQGRYEIQVLDSYNNKTYPNGQAGAFYGHASPLVNSSRKPGEWQTYDIIFHAPKSGADGKSIPGSFTVLHNGVLIQDHTPINGKPTAAAKFKGVAEKGPIMLQDHSNPVRYRNIWVRPL
jgi:hypothetical protein